MDDLRRSVGLEPLADCLARAAGEPMPSPPEGQIEFTLGERKITAGPGDFVNVPRDIVHCFHNSGTTTARMVLTFTPAGIEKFFEETLERAPNGVHEAPDNVAELVARYVAAAPKSGLEFV